MRAPGGLLLCLVHLITALRDEEKKTLVDKHNFYRSQAEPPAVDMKKLHWDTTLEELATSYAAKCIWDHNVERGHIGENLFLMSGSGLDVELGLADWYRERDYYNFTTDTCKDGQMCGHYTQMVWAGTERVGCGEKFCGKVEGFDDPNMHLLVCNYEPPGNFEGEKPYKTGVPCSACPATHICKESLCIDKDIEEEESSTSIQDTTQSELGPDPTQPEVVLDTIQVELVPDPTQVELVLDTIQSELVPDPTQPELVLDTIQAELVPDPTQVELVPEPTQPEMMPDTTQPELVLDTIQAELVPDPTQVELVLDPTQPEMVPDPTQSELVPDPTQSELVADPTQSELVPDPTQPEMVPDTTQAELVPNITPSELVSDTTLSEMVPDTIQSELVVDTTSAQTSTKHLESSSPQTWTYSSPQLIVQTMDDVGPTLNPTSVQYTSLVQGTDHSNPASSMDYTSNNQPMEIDSPIQLVLVSEVPLSTDLPLTSQASSVDNRISPVTYGSTEQAGTSPYKTGTPSALVWPSPPVTTLKSTTDKTFSSDGPGEPATGGKELITPVTISNPSSFSKKPLAEDISVLVDKDQQGEPNDSPVQAVTKTSGLRSTWPPSTPSAKLQKDQKDGKKDPTRQPKTIQKDKERKKHNMNLILFPKKNPLRPNIFSKAGRWDLKSYASGKRKTQPLQPSPTYWGWWDPIKEEVKGDKSAP